MSKNKNFSLKLFLINCKNLNKFIFIQKKKKKLEHEFKLKLEAFKKIPFRLRRKLPLPTMKKKKGNYRYILNKIINSLIKKGKKNKTYKMILSVFIKLKIITGISPFFFILKGLSYLKPFVDIFRMRKAGKVNEVPISIKKKRQLYFTLKWLLLGIKTRKGLKFINILITDLINLYFKKGPSFRFKEDLIRKVYKNRAITHYRKRKKR
jgi:ribosomal protein S7